VSACLVKRAFYETLAEGIDKQRFEAYSNFSPRCNENPVGGELQVAGLAVGQQVEQGAG
jgi:hypothetical protein